MQHGPRYSRTLVVVQIVVLATVTGLYAYTGKPRDGIVVLLAALWLVIGLWDLSRRS